MRSFSCRRHDALAVVDEPKTTTPGCIKVVTGQDFWSNGYLSVYINQGRGFALDQSTANKEHKHDSVVLNKCYTNLLGVRVKNHYDNAWIGSIKFAADKAGPFYPGQCSVCTKTGSTEKIAVDGNGNAAGDAPTTCLNEKMCDIKLPQRTPALFCSRGLLWFALLLASRLRVHPVNFLACVACELSL